MNDLISSSNLWDKLNLQTPETHNFYFASLSSIDISSCEHHFTKLGLVTDSRSNASMFIIAVETMGDHRLANINEVTLAAGKPLLVLKWCGLEIQAAIFSKQTACWACFEKRHKLLDASASYLENALPDQLPITEPLSYTKATRAFAFSWAAVILEQFIASQMDDRIAGKLYTYNISTLQQQIYPITKLQNCGACGLSRRSVFPAIPEVLFNKNMLTDSE